MKCNCGPESYAEKPGGEVRSKKDQDHGNIVDKQRQDQADRRAVLALLARQPARNSQRQKGNSTDSSQDYPGRLVNPLPSQKKNR